MNVHPTKIIRILGRLNIGGPAVHAVLLTEGLNNHQFQSILITGSVSNSEGSMLYFSKQHAVIPRIIPELGREISWRDDLIALWKLYHVCRNERPDIVHTHTAKAGTLGRIAAILARVPVRIHTFHGHVFQGYFNPLKTKLFLIIERFLAIFTTKIIAISDAQLMDLATRYRIAPRDKFRVVPIGLDLAPLLQNRTQEGMLSESLVSRELTLGFVGRLVPIKNPSMAIRVFERLIRSKVFTQPVRLIVAGDGELRAELEKQADDDSLRKQVLFIGWQKDMSSLYTSLDLVILTSLNEGTPVVLIEAMAASRPFVATRVGGLTDLMVGPEQAVRRADGRLLFSVFSNGVLVESDDVEGFTAALEFLLTDKGRLRRMGVEGRRFVKERFSKERLVHDIQELYQDCLWHGNPVPLEQPSGSVAPTNCSAGKKVGV